MPYKDSNEKYAFPAFSGNLSLRMEYALSPYIHLFFTPGYTIPLFIVETKKIDTIDNIDPWECLREQFQPYLYGLNGFTIQAGINVSIPLKK